MKQFSHSPLRLLFLLSTTILAMGGNGVFATSPAPNFLIIAIDDLNDYVGCLDGHPNSRTPNLDRLAKQGVLFTNAHCNSPVCNPSRASIFTGLRPTTTGINSNSSGWYRDRPGFENVVTLSQAMLAGGYGTYGYGKLYHPGNPVEGEWLRFRKYHYGPVQDPKLNFKAGISITDWGIPPDGAQASHDEEIAEQTIQTLLDEHNGPFFLGCGFFRPHTPLYAKQKWFDLHPLNQIQWPPGFKEGDNGDLVYFGKRERRPQDVEAPGLWQHDWVEENGKWKAILQAYLASTSAMDFQLGRVLDALAESAFADNTYLLCFSDHGYHLGEKRHWGKAALWELTTRVPFIIAGPGIPAGGRCDRPVDLLSVYPTVIDYAGIKAPHKLEGLSLRPLLENPDAEWPDAVLTTFVDHHALRTQDWRYIRYATGEEELYDQRKDPREFTNLINRESGRSEFADRLKTLRSQMDQLLNKK